MELSSCISKSTDNGGAARCSPCRSRSARQTREGLMGTSFVTYRGRKRKVVGLAKRCPIGVRVETRRGRPLDTETFKARRRRQLLPAAADGTPAPPKRDHKRLQDHDRFEKRTMSRDAVIAELEKSFAFLKASMTATPDAKLDAPLDLFGEKSTNRGLWISTTTHRTSTSDSSSRMRVRTRLLLPGASRTMDEGESAHRNHRFIGSGSSAVAVHGFRRKTPGPHRDVLRSPGPWVL